MNTREREVMSMSRHSRAMLLNVLWHHQGGSSAVGKPIRALLGIGEHDELTAEQVAEAKWIDALLAEGSASSEGAEAVAWQHRFRITGDWLPWSEGVGSVEEFKRKFSFNFENNTAEIRFLYTRPQPAQGEHEQRSGEGSEAEKGKCVWPDCGHDTNASGGPDYVNPACPCYRAPTNDESALTRGLPCVDCAYNPGLCDEHNNGGRPLDGLPAGSDATPIDMLLFCPRCHTQHVDGIETHHVDAAMDAAGMSTEFDASWNNPPHRSHLCHACGCVWRPADVATNGVAKIATRGKADTWDATAEQPSCGQDARGEWQPIETAPKDGTELILARCERVSSGHWMQEVEELASEFHASTGEYLGEFPSGVVQDACWLSWDGGFTEDEPPTHWMPLPKAPAAIAAQQRQGGAK